MATIKCEYCGKDFLKPDCLIGKSKHNYCSCECYRKGKRILPTIIICDTHAEFIANSPKCGSKKVLIDIEDIERVRDMHWSINSAEGKLFYVVSSIKGYSIGLHRYLTNCPKGMVVDHINHNPLDNRKSNLRICTKSENAQNRRFKNVNGFVGVKKLNSGKWFVQIVSNKNIIYLGTFPTFEEAKRARENGELKYFSHKSIAS